MSISLLCSCSFCFLLFLLFTVHPVIQVPNQLVGAPLGTDVQIECHVEASPKSINYWIKDTGKFVCQNYISTYVCVCVCIKLEMSTCVCVSMSNVFMNTIHKHFVLTHILLHKNMFFSRTSTNRNTLKNLKCFVDCNNSNMQRFKAAPVIS